MSGSRNWEANHRPSSEQARRVVLHQMHDNDLWEQFVQENWAPYLENAYGPDWRSSYPEDVPAILRWASSQAKDHEKEYPISEPRTMEASQQSTAPCGNSLTFGSFQPDSVEDEMPNGETKYSVSQERTKRASATEQLRSRGLSREERLPPPGLRLSDDADEMMVDEELYHPSWNRNLPDLNPLLEKLDLDGFPGFDWENLHMVMRGQMPNKHPPPSGSRQERLKVKRTGGTKRQGEDRNVLSAAANDKQHVQTIEQRIEITGSSATFEARTRSIPSKQVSGITNQPTFRIPIEYSSSTGPSPASLFQGYSFAATGNENGTSFKAFGSGTPAAPSTGNSYPYPANTSSIFSLFGSGISTSLEGTPPREWVMEETGMAVDIDDPHHPHKRVHKHFTAEASGKVNKAVKTKGRRHGSRQATPVFSSRVPSNQLHGMTSPVAPFSARAKLDDGMETKRDGGVVEKATDGLGESKFKREDEGGHSPKQGRSSGSVKNDRMREASQKTSLFMMTRAQAMDSASKGTLTASRSSSGRQGIGGGDPLSQPPPLPSSEAPLCSTETRHIIDRVDDHGRCPLHVAAMAGRAEIVEQLLQHGCDPKRVLPIDLLNQSSGTSDMGDCHSLWASSFCSDGFSKNKDWRSFEKSPQRGVMEASSQRRGMDTGSSSRCRASPDPRNVMFERLCLVDPLSFKYCNALHLAAYYGHKTVVEILLKNAEIDLEAKNENGCTALHIAANRGHKHIVACLLKMDGINVDAADAHGLTALHHAAAKGRSNIIDLLWPKGCKIDVVDLSGSTALHYAAYAGHVEAVGNLIIAGCPVSKFDNDGLTPGHLAAYKGYVSVLEKLLHAGFYHDMQGGETMVRNGGGSTALHLAAIKGHAPVIKQLLAEGANIQKEDCRGLSPLQCAAEGGHLEAFNILLAAGCNSMTADAEGKTLLHSAATGGSWDIVNKLLKLGCDPSARTNNGRTPLHIAAIAKPTGAAKVVYELLKRDCDICVRDDNGCTPWHAAAEGGNLKILEMFLSRGCNIEAKSHAGMTALHCAAASGSASVVKALVDHGANIRALNGNQQTALHLAAERGHEKVLTMMVGRVESEIVNLKDNKGNTILHHVCEGSSLPTLVMLVNQGADLNAVNNNRQTPLHIATLHHGVHMVKALLGQECDTSIKDIDGCTALHYAAFTDDPHIFNLLFPGEGCNVADKDRRGFGLLHYAVEGGNPEIVGRLLFRCLFSSGLAFSEDDCLAGAAQHDQVQGSVDVMNALHVACELGHVSVTSYLIKAGYSVRGKGPDGLEPVHYASGASGRDTKKLTTLLSEPRRLRQWTMKECDQHNIIVNMLLEKQADIHVVDDLGCNALMYAAGVGCVDLVTKFLEMNVDPDLRDHDEATSMHWAANSGNETIIGLLGKAGVPYDVCDRRGHLPLHRAAERGELRAVCAFVEAMVKKGSDIHRKDAEGFSPVHLAAAKGYVDVVTKLLEGAKEQDVKELTGLHLGIQMKMEDIVKSLLESGNCDVNARDAEGCTPLHYAAETGQQELVEWLLNKEADMFITSSDGMMPIHKAAAEGHLKTVEKLIDEGALKNYCTTSGSTPLHYAASSGKLPVIRLLIQKGIPVNQMSNGSVACTALYSAASNGNLDAVNTLLEHHAEVDTICANECTALHIAASHGHSFVVKRLSEAGAEVDFQATNSIAAIHNAVNNGHYETTKALIAADCDVDIQNSAGNTPLHIAACKGSQDLARLLLNANCDIHIKNAKGHQAIHSAASNGFFEVVLLLVQHGAPWRQKGDLDVAKMLCRKSNLMASYVDGRLRIAERAKHRKAKPTESSESIPTEEELKQRQAQADAIMAELLAEEEKEKKQGDQRQKGKRNKDKRRKNHSITDQRKELPQKVSKSPIPSDKTEEVDEVTEKEDEDEKKSEKDEEYIDAFPRVIMKGRERRPVESPTLFPELKTKSPPSLAETRQKRREVQNKQRKNRQPAPRPAETPQKVIKPPEEPESMAAAVKKTPPVSVAFEKSEEPSKGRGTSVTVIRRRTQAQPALVKTPAESKKLHPPATSFAAKDPPSKGPKKLVVSLTRSISFPESRGQEKTSVRHAPNRSLTMAAVVAGQSVPKKSVTPTSVEAADLTGQDDIPAPSPPRRTESTQIWVDAVKATMDKKPQEPKTEVLKGAVGKKKTVKVQKQESEVKVVNVSSSRKAFLPFAESTTIVDTSAAWTSKPSALTRAAIADEPKEPTGGMGANRPPPEERDTSEEPEEKDNKDPVLKWVTKELAATSGRSTELKGALATPLRQKMKQLSLDEEVHLVEKSEEAEEKLIGKQTSHHPWSLTSPHRVIGTGGESRVESPWKNIKSEKPWGDSSGFPPLAVNTALSARSLDSASLEALPTGYPFPGRSADWSVRNFDRVELPPPSPPVTSPQNWELPGNLDLDSVADAVHDVLDDSRVGFGEPPALMYHQMDPDSLLPPELKEEIANGGATSNHFRTKNSVSSSRGSPTPNQSPSAKPPASLQSNYPSWSFVQGPFFSANGPPPPPPPPPQSSTILSRIPDDPWEIDEVDVAALKPPLDIPQPPPPPQMHSYEDRVPYICPLSRRPITDPVVAADGITYDRASIQGNPGYYPHPYITYSNGYI